MGYLFWLLCVGLAFDACIYSLTPACPDGRRPIYLASLTLQCIGSFGVASVRTVPQLLTWRMLQAFGASSGGSVGLGVISDIYEIEERGTASGIFFAVSYILESHAALYYTDLPGCPPGACSCPRDRRVSCTLFLVARDAIRSLCIRLDLTRPHFSISTGNKSSWYPWHRSCDRRTS